MNIFKAKKKLILIGFFSLSVCIAALIWFQSSESNIVAAKSQTKLTLEVTTTQSKYLQGEPIPLNFKLSNQTTVPVTRNGLLGIGPDINLETHSETGTEVRWMGKDISLDTPGSSLEVMQPGKNREEQDLIHESLVEKLFPLPGRYELRVEFIYCDCTNGQQQIETIVSKPIIINIDEPHGANRRAYNYLKNVYDPINRDGKANEKMVKLQYFVDNFSDSVYWKYLAYKLAINYFMFGENEKAEREFLKISEIDFYYSKKIDQNFQVISRKLGRDKRNPSHQRGVTRNAPIAQPVPVPSIVPIPLPNNPPVRIPIPNPTP